MKGQWGAAMGIVKSWVEEGRIYFEDSDGRVWSGVFDKIQIDHRFGSYPDDANIMLILSDATKAEKRKLGASPALGAPFDFQHDGSDEDKASPYEYVGTSKGRWTGPEQLQTLPRHPDVGTPDFLNPSPKHTCHCSKDQVNHRGCKCGGS